VNMITTSPSGGMWMAGFGTLVRVAERLDLADGWEIVERPTASNGVLSLNIAAVVEDADGTLWLGTDVGLQKIPPGIRRRQAPPPSVELVSGTANGVPIESGGPVDLPHRRNRLDVEFSALTYRDPAAVRYRMRLHDNEPWSADSADGHFTFVDLAPGSYDLQVIASLDGSRWSESAARLGFRVLRPWYMEPWIPGGATLAIAGLGHIGYRLRVRRRLARERQRTRIAMDLHDEVGSGLGTIAVLAGIVGRPDLAETRRGDVAGRITAVSQELARSLTDIVWSLRTSSGSLDALWDQLLERARPLFEGGHVEAREGDAGRGAAGHPRVTFEAPDPVPQVPLSLVVRRNLHLVAYEALHNAARHAQASRVVLRLARDGRDWRLEIEDDGRGLAADLTAPSVRRGLGIEAIRSRVAEMGGSIAWDRGEMGGTRVIVRFRTGGE
jgi:signal transduction histidine kinase